MPIRSLQSRPRGTAATRVFLIIDDARIGARLLRRFHAAGMESRSSACCRNAESAIRLWNPDVVVVHGAVPDEEWALLRARLASDPLCRVRPAATRAPEFVIAARDLRPATCQSVMAHGAADLVRIPIRFAELAARVERAAASRRELTSVRVDAFTDRLTGLWNRRQLAERATELRATTARSRQPLTCVVAAVEGLASINAELGRDAGDAVLRSVGERLHGAARSSDPAFRIGPAEFLLLAPGVALRGGRRLAERLQRAVAAATVPVTDGDGRGRELAVSIDVGVAEWAPRAILSEVLRLAERDRCALRREQHATSAQPGSPVTVT